MRHLRLMLLSCFCASLLLLADSAYGDVRKCTSTRSGLPVVNSEPLLVVDGKIIGDLDPQGADVRSGHFVIDDQIAVTPEDILRIDIVCLEVSEGDRTVGRSAVALVTRTGAVSFMQSHLGTLAELQWDYRAATGRYAESLRELDFFTSRPPLPIELAANDDGWTAHVQLEGLATACQARARGGEQDRPVGQDVVCCEGGLSDQDDAAAGG
jgi:hypothetical protein